MSGAQLRTNMAEFRSSSNDILNCRTIDDGQTEKWLRTCHHSPKVELRSVTSVECVESGIGTCMSTSTSTSSSDELLTCKCGNVAKGFTAVLGSSGSVTYLRGRTIYRSDMAPRVSLKVNFTGCCIEEDCMLLLLFRSNIVLFDIM